MISRRVLIVRQ